MENNTKALILDIETSGLFVDMVDYSSFPYKLKPDANLWCIVIRNAYTDEVVTLVKEEITKERLEKELEGCTHLIGHNLLKFDLLASKLFGVLDYSVGYIGKSDMLFGKPVKIIDTLILSRLFNPDRYSGHSLESWGQRTGTHKIDFRQICIDKGYIQKSDPKGAEFKQFCPEMVEYCIGDTDTNKLTFFALVNEMEDYKGWSQAIAQENKLADLAIKRENLGFWFDKEAAVKAVEELTIIMQELTDKVNPILPPKPMNKGEMAFYIPPKVQLKADGKPSSNMMKFADKVGGEVGSIDERYVLKYKDRIINLPFEEPLETHVKADISNLDHVKMTLIDVYGWIPQEWAERDLTKDSKKQSISVDKRITALEKWYNETMDGKYKKLRLEIACERFKVEDEEDLLDTIKEKLYKDFPVRIPTSPKVRVGVEKELCPNLIAIGEKVDFANDFALFLTYKHRKACIAGGDIEDMDFDIETPNTGYLSNYREVDGRVPTPAIEIGAASNRYRHIGVANVPRASSVYGKEMRSLFGCGEGFLQLGYDFSSLENRVQGGYVRKYEDGEALAAMLLAEKPNDLHSINAVKLGISRSDAKSFGYAILYGASPAKLGKMLNISLDKAKELYEAFWSAVPALKQLKDAVQKFWESTDKKYVRGIDGRKIFIRSPHSLLNFLFQSGGVICAKYVTVYMAEELESKGYCIDPFEGTPDAANMIEYHDEAQMLVNPSLLNFQTFKTKEEGLEFIENWDGEHQLSTLKEGNTWYVALPNEVSIAIKNGIKKTEDLLKLDFELGFEFDVHRTWHGCH